MQIFTPIDQFSRLLPIEVRSAPRQRTIGKSILCDSWTAVGRKVVHHISSVKTFSTEDIYATRKWLAITILAQHVLATVQPMWIHFFVNLLGARHQHEVMITNRSDDWRRITEES